MNRIKAAVCGAAFQQRPTSVLSFDLLRTVYLVTVATSIRSVCLLVSVLVRVCIAVDVFEFIICNSSLN